MEFQMLIERAVEIRKQYGAKERKLYGSSWTSEEIALGFVGDVGDLAKLIIAENGKRNIENSQEKLNMNCLIVYGQSSFSHIYMGLI